MLETLFWTVSFCLGFNMSMQKHNVLYFLRKPFVNIFYEIENKKNLLKMFPMSNSIKKEIFLLETKYFILKPLILCVTCMPSFWGSAIFILMNGIAFKLIPYLILNSFAAVFINTFINDFYERYIK